MKHKVFCIGFHKTGTTSLEVALKKLGYRVTGSFGTKDPAIADKVHALAREKAADFDAFEDNPWPVLYRELDEWYPGSRFILTRRPAADWIRSQVKDFATTETPMRRWIYGEDAGCPEGNEETYVARYERHNREVLDYFRNRPDDLLIIDFPQDARWDRLCAFLGHPVPDEPFPHANKASISRKLKNWIRKRIGPRPTRFLARMARFAALVCSFLPVVGMMIGAGVGGTPLRFRPQVRTTKGIVPAPSPQNADKESSHGVGRSPQACVR